ncbi:MAG: hypothetical protein LC745_05980, partial [Planctomycetia bacterium]|nr:hypothetical protein [Planctomycetia bacterium]
YDLALFRPDAGLWIVRTASGGTTFSSFGDPLNGDVAAPGDYDGDGKVDLAIFRPGTALFVIQYSSGLPKSFTSLGDPVWGDLPVSAPLASLGLIKPTAIKALAKNAIAASVRPVVAPVAAPSASTAVAPWVAPVFSPETTLTFDGVAAAKGRKHRDAWLTAADDLATRLRSPFEIDRLLD